MDTFFNLSRLVTEQQEEEREDETSTSIWNFKEINTLIKGESGR
jgi:hypothetical protein